MATTTKHYADLASNSYDQPNINQEYLNENNKRQPVYQATDGHKYRILANASNPNTGYQGTIYQDADSNEIIIAHRGTEPKDLNDIKADGQMAGHRDNMQIADALALTQKAIQYTAKWNNNHSLAQQIPPPTFTGHSLGGALGEVTAYRLGLHGETFNSYGAADLKGMPKNAGQNQVINHVIATDMVSAAAPHFGSVKIYARESDIAVLIAAGYGQYNPIEDKPKTLGSASLGSAHLMKYFTATDSVLNDPQALERGKSFANMITTYRNDVFERRDTVSNTFDRSPKTSQNEQRYHSSSEFNDKGEYKNYDVKPGMMGTSSFTTQQPAAVKHTPHKAVKDPDPVEQRYHPSYEFNDKGEYKNYDRKPGMFGTSSDASDTLHNAPNIAAASSISETDPQINRMMAVMTTNPAFAAMSREEMAAMAQDFVSLVQQAPTQPQVAEVMQSVQAAPAQEAYLPTQQARVVEVSPQENQQYVTPTMSARAVAQTEPALASPKPAITNDPIVLPRELASLHEQLTEKFGNQLSHLSQKDQQTTIALATSEAAKFHARTVDDVFISPEGNVLMMFDNKRTGSAEINLAQVSNYDANQILTATVNIQQTQQQELAQRQSQSQSGPTMTL